VQFSRVEKKNDGFSSPKKHGFIHFRRPE
jgi:hypothetical protein